MREIKFRVWDKLRKKFAKQITTFKFDRNGDINLVVYLDRINKTREILDKDRIYTNEFDIMQYIGLKDKNGKEIYEGDIVEYEGEKYTITYDEYAASYILKEGKEQGWVLGGKGWEKVKVVGNVYENPELLE